MATKIKLGNGDWGVKENGLLAYNDEDNIFKAIEMNHSRSSTATRVNSAGTIVESGIGVPRIDFKDDSNGALLLEPTSTNLVNYSEDFSTIWGLVDATISTDAVISPKGDLTADKLVESATTAFHFTDFSVVLGANPYTFSCFMKSAERTSGSLFLSQSGNNGAVFDLDSGVVSSISGTGNTASIEDYGNGWYRCSVINDGTADVVDSIRIGVQNGALDSYTGDGTSGIYIWGAQVEQLSYATSYIPTSGAIATRIADTCSKSGLENYIGQTEGTIFIESNNLYPSGTRTLGMLYTSGSAFYQIYLTSSNEVRVDVNGVLLFLSSPISVNTKNKIAFSYKSGQNILYINGNQAAVSTSTSIPSSLNTFYLGNFNGGEQSGSFTSSKIYNTRLSNSELQSLTS